MNVKLKKTFCAGIALALVCAASGCEKKEADTKDVSENNLTYWVEFGNQPQSGVNNFAELPVYKEILKKTGVNVTFKHPVNGQVKEQFNLLLASQELPDIIQYQFATDYPGGAAKAIKDGCITELDMSKAPNLKAYLDKNKNIDKQVKTDDGKYYTFPCIYGDDSLLVYTGIITRKDILEKIGCEMPETIDEWHSVLTKAKESGIKSPLTLSYGNTSYFAQAFGIVPGTYIEDGKVKYGENEEGFKTFIETMRTWYKEGLLDSKIASIDGKIIKQNVLNGETIATVGNVGGGIGTWSAALKGTQAKLEPAPYPVINKGSMPFSGHRINEYSPFGSACITPKCKNLDAAYKLLDFGYGEEGHMLFNFGIEGKTYEMVNDYPKYTEFMTNNPEGKAMGDLIGIYASPNGVAPTVKDARYMEQFSSLPEQKSAITLWNKTDAKNHLMPPVTLTIEESDQISKIGTEITSYIEQTALKFITGVEPIEKYDEFKNNLKSYGIDKYIEIYQKAYDRDLER